MPQHPRELLGGFTDLQNRKAQIIARLAPWSTLRLHFHPAADQWSAAQVLDHIAKVESGILAATRSGLNNPQPIGARDRLGRFFIERVFRSERKVKVPASASQVLPGHEPEIASTIRNWDAIREDMARFVSEVTPAQMTGGVFRHPVSGWLSLPGVLAFLAVHIHHHGFQLDRLADSSEGM